MNDILDQRKIMMGEDLGQLFHHLWEDLAWLNQLFVDYEQLFSDDPQRIEIMNKTAPVFFSAVQQAMADSILLRISRMTDPATSPKKGGNVSNVTVQGLKLSVQDVINDQLQQAIVEALGKSAFARDWRDRHIAHADLKLALGEANPLSHASRDTIRTSLTSLGKVLSLLEAHFMDTYTDWHPVSPLGTPEDMLRYLRAGIQRRDEQLEAFCQNKLDWQDLDFDKPL